MFSQITSSCLVCGLKKYETVERADRIGLNFSNFQMIWRPNYKIWKPTNFRRLCQSFNLVLAKNSSPKAPKTKIFKKMKKLAQIFTQETSVQNFSQISTFLKSPGSGQISYRHCQILSSNGVEQIDITGENRVPRFSGDKTPKLWTP